ncbi:MAG: hypothetical protein KatS3mg108_1453 [Isosphaeraceae bacterium]|jgi:predicted RNA-binding protein with PIN domain|nr:MAG: hypothetical protein KatS3mg108_1453 [Isosphaeraceae bacterium]
MHYLIDGYNLMHAKGLLSPRLRPAALRRNRQQFLDAVVEALGPFAATRTTVVFDAAHPPAGRPDVSHYKGIRVIYAVGDESADARIEAILADYPTPKGLTVISSDRRVRQAALRRKAKVIDSDSFWTAALAGPPSPTPSPDPPQPERPQSLSPRETQHWLDIFADADQPARSQELPGDRGAWAPSDAELARIAREVDAEDVEW